MSENWYRNRDWTPDIAADFEKRIARARTQKAQYLMLQGYALIERHPDIAAEMLERSIALDDSFFLNAANCYLAAARLALGDVEGALTAYEAALEAQLRLPNVRTSAPLDYAFTVAWFGRKEQYELALTILEAVQPSVFKGANAQAYAAHALILADLDRVELARITAKSALSELPREEPDWGGISIGEMRRRLEAIAAIPA
jgi:tetratricopeptide (TPR) repeat protein